MRKLIVLAQLCAATAFAHCGGTAPAHAADGPWCVIFGGAQGAMEDCRMRSFEECRQEMIAGNRGSCFPNPHWHAEWQQRQPQRFSAPYRD